ncbi:hypothetical protein AGMMS50284_5150 [Clostridia bacterium]|nr:hypothetical protein AGMMS50284_5150 [Clostridia bacterium]
MNIKIIGFLNSWGCRIGAAVGIIITIIVRLVYGNDFDGNLLVTVMTVIICGLVGGVIGKVATAIKRATNGSTTTDRIILGMGIAYLLFLTWAILWKCGMPFIGNDVDRTVNLLPFSGNTNWELQFNIIIFVPFGFYLAAAIPKLSLLRRVLVTLATSFVFEAVQFVLVIGRSDVTDLLMNTLGGVVGIAGFYLLSKLFGKHERKATLVICVLLTLIEMYMTVSFIIWGQLNLGFMTIRL